MTKPVKDSEVILATSQELKAYSQLDSTTRETTFCEYLKKTHKSSAVEVIANLSGQTFSDIDLSSIDLVNGIDLGNIITGERDGKPTKFQNCDLKKVKFRSKEPMKGLEFTGCTMSHALFIADLDGVNFGPGSDISSINLKKAYNIDKCIITTDLPCYNIELGFPDTETFKKHMEWKFIDQEIEYGDKKAHQADIKRRKENTPDTPEGDFPDDPIVNEGWTFGFPDLLGRTLQMAGGAATAAFGLTQSAISAVFSATTTNVTLGADEAKDPIILHNTAIQKILEHSPKFSPSSREIDEKDKVQVTKEDVQEWIEACRMNGPESSISLSDTICDGDNDVLHLEGLDLRSFDFSNLEFGNVVMSKCDFIDAKFNKCDLNHISARDCYFDRATFTEVQAKYADLTRSTFCGAHIDKMTFTGSTLVDTNFLTASQGLPTQLYNTNFDGADMRSADFSGAKIQHSSMNNANMQDLRGEDTMLFNVSADNVNLSNAQMQGVGIEDVRITNSIGENADFSGSSLLRTKITGFNAPGINLDNSDQQQVAHTDVKYLNGTMNKAVTKDVNLDNADTTGLQMQELNTKIPDEISLTPAQLETTQDARDWVEGRDLINPDATIAEGEVLDKIIKALEDNESALNKQGLTITNSHSRGTDHSGSHLINQNFTNVDFSLSNWKNVRLENCTFTNCNLHGADLSNAEMINTTMEGTDLTSANMEGIKVSGGKWKNVDISDANIINAQLGTRNANLDMQDVKGTDVTNLANTKINAIDPRALDQKALIKITDFNNKVTVQTPTAIATKCTRQMEIAGNLATKIGSTIAIHGKEAVNALADSTEAMVAAAKNKKRSRMGLTVGIVLGGIAGALLLAAILGTGGIIVGALPVGIAAAAVIGGGAVSGGILGTFLQNTSKGRGFLAIAATLVTAAAIGPVALLVTPAIVLYHTFTNRNSSVRDTFGSVLKTLIANPLKKIARYVAYIAPSEAEMIDAKRMYDTRIEVKNKTKEERAVLESQNVPTNGSALSGKVTEQQISIDHNMQTKSITKDTKAPTSASIKQSSNTTQQKTSWGTKIAQVANSVAKKITPKKNTSNVGKLQAARTDNTKAPTSIAQ